jgi:hypothetical protein
LVTPRRRNWVLDHSFLFVYIISIQWKDTTSQEVA